MDYKDTLFLLEMLCPFFSIVFLCIIFFYNLYFFSNLSSHKSSKGTFNLPVSIIICAKNELENLKKNIPTVLSQNYPKFEIIIVNDQSTDGSCIFLEELQKKYTSIRIVNIEKHINHLPGKKFALSLGIKTAQFDYLLLTDADCIPKSKFWLRKMVANFQFSEVILGYGAYEKTKGFLSKMIRFDTFFIAKQYLSFSLKGLSYMAVGRNLAYKKSIFFENKGFASHIHIPSGDDDLFIQEIACNANICIETSMETHTVSKAPETFSDWVFQKRRHISTSPNYKNKYKLLLALYSFSQLFFWISIIILFLIDYHLLFIYILLFLRLVISYSINYKLMKRLDVFDLYLFYPFYQITLIIFHVIFVLLNLISKPKKWRR